MNGAAAVEDTPPLPAVLLACEPWEARLLYRLRQLRNEGRAAAVVLSLRELSLAVLWTRERLDANAVSGVE